MGDSATASGEGSVPANVEHFGYRQELKRSLGLFDLLVYGLVFIVPTAPFPVFGIIFNASEGMVPLVYAVGLVAMMFTAFSYMTMSRAFPVAGSVYTYASRTIGETLGFFAGWGSCSTTSSSRRSSTSSAPLPCTSSFREFPRAYGS